ncbi:hypothetical protein POM88_040679 [Heracleum sosnowskyi]|uniref:F-box domain-containing protein n=1 Tax=Heracleum sosnowskyi TaxID=360622 RepID=A0AAD8MAK6_9APIA|nr:hypothetical protein POM88_040679 [Heracleum sosnowskyi]
MSGDLEKTIPEEPIGEEEVEEVANFDDWEDEADLYTPDPLFQKELKKQQAELRRKEDENAKVSDIISQRLKIQKAEEEEEEEEQQQVKVRSWAELEWDLLGEIVSRLFVTDQARFRVVCKNWLVAAHPIINANATKPSLPWQGCNYPGCCSEFQIFDPLSSSPKHLASRHIIDWSQLDDVVVQSSGIMTIRSFVFNGELMIIGFNRYVKNLATLPGQQFVRRYDRLSKVWIPVTTLSDYALFFNYKFADVSLINTKDRTRNRVLPNKIYRFFNGGCLVYSLEDGKLVEFKSINSNLLEHGGDDLPEYKYKYNYATPDTYSSFWLEAPRVRSSSRGYTALETRETMEL